MLERNRRCHRAQGGEADAERFGRRPVQMLCPIARGPAVAKPGRVELGLGHVAAALEHAGSSPAQARASGRHCVLSAATQGRGDRGHAGEEETPTMHEFLNGGPESADPAAPATVHDWPGHDGEGHRARRGGGGGGNREDEKNKAGIRGGALGESAVAPPIPSIAAVVAAANAAGASPGATAPRTDAATLERALRWRPCRWGHGGRLPCAFASPCY